MEVALQSVVYVAWPTVRTCLPQPVHSPSPKPTYSLWPRGMRAKVRQSAASEQSLFTWLIRFQTQAFVTTPPSLSQYTMWHHLLYSSAHVWYSFSNCAEWELTLSQERCWISAAFTFYHLLNLNCKLQYCNYQAVFFFFLSGT